MVDMIQAHGLVKRYKEVTALAGLDLPPLGGQKSKPIASCYDWIEVFQGCPH